MNDGGILLMFYLTNNLNNVIETLSMIESKPEFYGLGEDSISEIEDIRRSLESEKVRLDLLNVRYCS